jgi:uncharacterized protein (DUF1800 family)
MPLPQYTGTLGHTRAAHLLRRATFGPNKSEIDMFTAYTPQQAITELFPAILPDPILPLNPETGQDWLISGTTGAEIGVDGLTVYLTRWFLSQAIDFSQGLGYSTREKVVFFLHTHFTTRSEKVRNSRSLYFQNQLFRQFAFDKDQLPEFNFKMLVKKVSADNAMLKFLDGSQNVKGSPNENYGRELLELYTLGRGLEGTLPTDLPAGDYVNYTEQDVQAAARVLSGYKLDLDFITIDPDTLLPSGSIAAGSHDNDPKQFSNRLANQIIEADPLLLLGSQATAESTLDELDQLIELIYAQEEAARYLSRKLYRFYVYHEITETIESTIIAEMAQTFINSGFKLQEVIEELLQSQHFYEAASSVDDDKYGGIIRSPLDVVAGTMRFFNIALPDSQLETASFYDQTGDLVDITYSMGMPLYNPFEVAGYGAYHQYPAYNRNWISSNYLTQRYSFIQYIINHMNLLEPDMLGVDVFEYTRANFTNAVGENAFELIMAYAKYLLPVHGNLTFDPASDADAGLTAERLNYFIKAFLYEPQFDDNPEAEWTSRWNSMSEVDVMKTQLDKLINALMQSPEFQLM